MENLALAACCAVVSAFIPQVTATVRAIIVKIFYYSIWKFHVDLYMISQIVIAYVKTIKRIKAFL